MELVGKRARQEALVKAMKETSEALAGKAAKDGVAEELEKVVKAREHAYESAQQLHKSGDVSQSELLESEGKLAESRAKVLERRDLVAERSGGTIMVDLNRELQSVVVTVAEAEARLTLARKTLAGFEEARDALEQLQQYEGERELRAAALARARDVLADATQKYPPPQLVVKLKSSEAAKDK
jgi:peptidoglycan hydrolase CwlO-like protein